jgi:hypothetical protein
MNKSLNLMIVSIYLQHSLIILICMLIVMHIAVKQKRNINI